jgi:hypothetical protein
MDDLEYQRSYYLKNKAKIKSRVAAWRSANRDKYNAYMRSLRSK